MGFKFNKATLLFLVMTWVPSQALANDLMPIDDFVQQTFIEGLPYMEASMYSEDDLPVLIDLLSQHQYIDYWGNIVAVMSVIGSQEAVDAVIDFIENDPMGDLGEVHYKAKKTALYGLGYAIHKNKNKKAREYLVASLNLDIWKMRNISNMAERHASINERNLDLSKSALFGIALSGTIKTNQILKDLEKKDKKDSKIKAHVEKYLPQLILENEKIKKDGLVKYYKKFK